MTRDEAETLAIRALSWLAAQDELWPGFLGATGITAADLRSAAEEPEFLAAVLDYLTQSDAWVTEFCDTAGLDYMAPLAARRCLSPESDIHWT